jgi:hypothetical protein
MYANSLVNGYALDDNYVIDGNERIENAFKDFPAILTEKFVQDDSQAYGYRPVVSMVFAVEYALFGARPFVGHLINLLLYMLTGCLLLRLFTRWFRNYPPWLPLAGVLLFIILPVHSEVVNNIKCRDELLAVLFAIGALSQTDKFLLDGKWTRILWIVLLCALSLLSKLSTVTILLLIPLYTIAKKEYLKSLVLGGVIFLSGIAIRALVRVIQTSASNKRNLEFIENPLAVQDYSLFERIPIGLGIIYDYLALLIFPQRLISYYGYDAVAFRNWSSPQVYVALILITAMVYLMVRSFRKHPILSFAIAFFLGGLAAISNILKPIIGIIGERFVYWPSLGFVVMVTIGLFLAYSRLVEVRSFRLSPKAMMFSLYGFLFVFALSVIWPRNAEWENRLVLYKADADKAPRSVKLNMLYADMVLYLAQTKYNLNKTELNKSIKYYKRAREIYPDYNTSATNLAVAEALKGNLSGSVEAQLEARRSGTKVQQNSVAIARDLIDKNNYQAAEDILKAFTEDYPSQIDGYILLMEVLDTQGKMKEALNAGIKAIQAVPSSQNLVFRQGQIIAVRNGLPYVWADLLLEKEVVNMEQYDEIRNRIARSYGEGQ